MKNEPFKDDIHMLSQPLLTEDGFINEACLNELAAAFKSIPKIHDRVQDDPEWTSKRWTTLKDITGSFAKSAVRQSHLSSPLHLAEVVGFLDASLRKSVNWDHWGDEHYAAELSLIDVSRLLYGILYEQGISYFDEWNEGSPFIDLDALLGNVCIDIRGERRLFDQFNAEFESKWKDKENAFSTRRD